MKNLIKSLCVTAAVLTAGMFIGCSNDDNQINVSGDTQKVTLKLNIPTMAQTRTAGAAINAGKELTLNKVTLVFTNAGGTVTAAFAAPGDYTVEELQKGITVKVSGDSKKVYAVANTNVTPVVGTNFQALVADKDATGGNGLAAGTQLGEGVINIFGVADIVAASGKSADAIAKDTIAPTVARFEVTDLTADGMFESFDVEGVYMDGFYKNASISGTLGDVKQLTKVAAQMDVDYVNEWAGAIFDKGSWSSGAPIGGTAQVAAPTEGVWGYYVFAQPYKGESFDFSSTTGSAVPRIIIKINNVKLKAGSSQTDINYYEGKIWYVTAHSFNFNNKGTDTEIGSIVGGYVIKTKAGSFKISESTVHEDPNVDTISVDVIVTPIVWKGIEVTPNL
ncbi:MAG: hypothetical protein LBM62_08655 [Mediterranea sp.]|jgi:hypothetical protein|nr:hypothetical protein [Mediterranea sp.]